ncbi:pilus assembly protein TadG-related protein [Novosphingobium sp. ES2-1]|uniref:pilus assembly protein TadG-related protein n=1 Tax=Novosphingobium sp. ES2-1 TaxID=2780074 RepID=UPI001880CE44|nr:pilus assembly protein TadG-related protein [Novosphingobium sp. ES2-1]QOV96251.1 hypothetical protein IM701_18270 [Novosphingobium sp. ES2-1]
MPRPLSGFVANTDGAIAPMYVIALFSVLAMAGFGYDYAQLASLDTELQNAADQAALAAVTQLNGQADARTLATAAAGNLVENRTIFASDAADARKLVVASTTFYASRTAAEAGTPEAASDAAARFVRVNLSTRRARYTLTPLVGLFTSPDVTASAVAGLSSSICGVPPVLMCNPSPDPNVWNLTPGQGLKLDINNVQGGAGSLAFLDFSGANFGTLNALKQKLAALMGFDAIPGDCISIDSPKTSSQSPENTDIPAVITALNTRFDIYDKSDPIKCYDQGLCSPSDNVRKELVQVLNNASSSPEVAPLSAQSCWGPNNGTGGAGQGWQFPRNPYRPTSSAALASTVTPTAMGLPRDLVHAYPGGVTSFGRIGNGIWDIQAYWRSNFGTAYANNVNGKAAPTRYEVYKWERDTGKLSSFGIKGSETYPGPGKSTKTEYFARYSGPVCKTGLAPTASRPDRRILSAAVVNCAGLSSTTSATVTPITFVDLFLVEPSLRRTGFNSLGDTVDFTQEGEVYVEFIKKTTQAAAGSTAPQFVRRDKPYLIK